MTDRSADKDPKTPPPVLSAGARAREAKLAAALRANLTRRKAAAREAAADAVIRKTEEERDEGQA